MNLCEAVLSDADLLGANLNQANLNNAYLGHARLKGAELKGAHLRGARLEGADLQHTTLVEANLDEANLNYTNLFGANLTGASLQQAGLANADLHDANLVETNLKKANLREANLKGSNLGKATLEGALLIDTDLRFALFEGTDFASAIFSSTVLLSIDFSKAIGLEKTDHLFASFLDIDTVHKSKGKMPVAFLRGCGLSDLDIEYTKLAAPGLDPEQVSQIIYEIHHIYLKQPIRFYDSFISYSSKDDEFARKLYDDLQNSGVRCWFAPEDLKIGDRIRPTIDSQIQMREKLIVIISENSLKSEWVGDEVEAALEQERMSGKDVIFPLRLDDAVLNSRDDWAAKLKRRRNIGDFSKWKDDAAYQKMFKRLLRDLRASQE